MTFEKHLDLSIMFDDMFAKCIVSIVVIILNYIFGKKLVFRKEKSDEKV